MKHFKLFEEFSAPVSPDAGTHGAVSFTLDSDECDGFGIDEYSGDLIPVGSEEYDNIKDRIFPELRNLVETGKVSCDGCELWYFKDDLQTKKILRKYIDI
jgi:hypothetical protein